jgi:uncharacterized protein YodC (DUF2158 family)
MGRCHGNGPLRDLTMTEFKVGDIVRLKQGGPSSMRVVGEYKPDSYKPLYLLWFIPIGNMPPLSAQGVVCEFWNSDGERRVRAFWPDLLDLV